MKNRVFADNIFDEEDTIAQVECSHCKKLHDIDDIKCPHCKPKL